LPLCFKLFAAVRNACVARFGFFLRREEIMSLPPDILLFGQRLSYPTFIFVSHLLISLPVSASISDALVSLTP